MHHLREYQIESINSIRKEFQTGKRKALLWLATGGGKTTIFSKIVKDAVSRNKNAIIVVRGRKLVDQASQRLTRESVPHGVLMNGHWNHRPHLPVQVCSIDTLISRELKPPADLIIIDEAHLAVSKGYKEFLEKYPQAFIVSVTATPYVDTSLEHIAETIVHPISMQGLIDQGYLTPFRIFAPSVPDVSRVKVSSSTKDFVTNDLAKVMETSHLTGCVVSHWRKIAQNKPTLCFAVNIHHSKILVDKFLEAGIKAVHCDADSSDEERNSYIRALERKEIQVISNVGIFSTGVDIPSIEAIILARPTKSKNLFIQQVGRGTRPSPGKNNCVLLDHAGNILRHGFPTDEPNVNLKGKPLRVTHPKESKVCDECFAIYRGEKCNECGKVPETRPANKEIKEVSGELIEISPLKEMSEVVRIFHALCVEAKQTGKKQAWAMYELVNRIGYQRAAPALPAWFKDLYNKNNESPLRKMSV